MGLRFDCDERFSARELVKPALPRRDGKHETKEKIEVKD
jgi:hypothetical protein